MSALQTCLTDPKETGQILFSSLLILGLDATALEHTLRTPVNQKMFVHMNKRLGETILHFLFVCIDQEKAAKVFRDCWPFIDKKQEAQFHKATFEWYKSLQQSYGQPLPAVVAKTFMAPGGPKFTSTVMTLTRIALHSSIARKAPDCTLLHFPSHSRNSKFNRKTLFLLQASKFAHHQNFITKQRTRQEVLRSLRDKAKELSSMYRRHYSENEKAVQELQEALNNNKRLSQHQKDAFFMAPLSAVQKEILDDLAKMKNSTGKLWEQVEKFRLIEEASWKIFAPLLDGTTFLSHINGSMYSPQVPEMVYKTHFNTINKMGLHGLYFEDKLDLLSLMQYSNLALSCLLDTIRTTHCKAKPESTEELNVQLGRVTSLNETVNNLNSQLNTLLPSLMENVATYRRQISNTWPSIDLLDLEGKPHLCPPTPPLSLINSPVAIKAGTKFCLLQLTPGMQTSQHGLNMTPNKLVSTTGIRQAVKKSPKADVVYSHSAHNDSIQLMAGKNTSRRVSEAGLTMALLTVDCRGRYQRKRQEEQELLHSSHNLHKKQEYKSHIPKRCLISKNFVNSSAVNTKANIDKMDESGVENLANVNLNEEISTVTKCNKNRKEEFNNSLLDKQVKNIADEGNDSGAEELLDVPLWDEAMKGASTSDSGCVEISSDSDTLLNAVEQMDITPKHECFSINVDNKFLKGIPHSTRKTLSPLHGASPRISSFSREARERWKLPTEGSPIHFPQFKDSTQHGALLYSKHASDKNRVSNSCRIPNKQEVACVSKQNTEQTNIINESSQNLLEKMSFLIQNPIKENTSTKSSRTLTKFDGLKFSLGDKISSTERLTSDEHISQSSTLEKLRYHSKANLNLIMEQAQQMKLKQPLRARKCESKSNFMSFVEKLKNGKDVDKKLSKKQPKHTVDWTNPDNTELVCTTSPVEELTSSPESNKYGDKTNVDIYQECDNIFKRMQSLLGDDDEDTFTESNLEMQNIEETHEAEETFANSADNEDILSTPGRKSSYLPDSSVFDTLTDSILVGESALSILNDDAAKMDIRRESISSHRQSLISQERTSLGSSSRLSEIFTTFQSRLSNDYSGILDVSDSCLLSLSMEDFNA